MSVISSPSGASIWRQSQFRPARQAGEQGSAAPAGATADAGNAQDAAPSALSDPRSALQRSLSQGLQDYMQKLRVDLNRPVKQSSEADSMQKKALKERVEALRRMMMMVHDKSSLRALASELARLAKDLKALVTSMTQNAADSQMAVSVDGQSDGGRSGDGQDAAASSSDAVQDGGAAAADAAASDATASGESDGSQDAAAGQAEAASAQQQAAAQADAGQAAAQTAAGGGQKEEGGGNAAAVDPQAALHSMLSGGKGNPVAGDPDIQEILQTLKMVKEFIKQQAQQLQSQAKRDVRDQLEGAEKALEDVNKILKGGPEAEQVITGQISVNIGDAAAVVDNVGAGGGGVNVSA
ncbi:hypothetical protein [Chromobacterium sp. CV08]|uniref:hypothetical protein n=1 Tax=Chromobacterium sp. CV08 TaxID=3133274 RepID=UPI003DA7C99A